MPGSRMFLLPTATPTVDELLRGLIVVSGNDATIALAEGVAGQRRSVRRAHEPAGAAPGPERHPLRERDRLARPAALLDGRRSGQAGRSGGSRLPRSTCRCTPCAAYTYNGITQPNRNVLLGRDPRVDGLKTGHTENAGYCLIATAHSGDRQLLAVVMGASSENARAIEAQKLLNYGFQYYRNGAPVRPGRRGR